MKKGTTPPASTSNTEKENAYTNKGVYATLFQFITLFLISKTKERILAVCTEENHCSNNQYTGSGK